MRHLLFTSLAFAFTSMVLAEDHLVVPNGYEFTSSPTTFLSPFANTGRIYQILIHQDQLTAFVGKSIGGFAMRQGSGTSNITSWPTVDQNVTNYEVLVGPSVAPADRTLVPPFVNNRVGEPTQVRTGPLTVPIGFFPPGVSLEFSQAVSFDTPYLYTGGHLLMEIRQTGLQSSLSVNAIGTSGTLGYGSQFTASWMALGSTATTASQGNFAITKFIEATGPTIPITGSIAFPDYLGDITAHHATMTLTDVGSSTPIRTALLPLSATGEYTFNVPASITPGSYDLYADGSPFLKRKQTIVLTVSGATGINYVLPTGDTDDSTEVDLTDIDNVISAYGTGPGDPPYSLQVDLDGSGEVELNDIDIVIAHYGQGDE